MSWASRLFVLAGVITMPGLTPQTSGALRAGAAKVDITPPADAAVPMSGYASRQEGFKGIHDRIYARAIVVDDGVRHAALVSWELIGVPNALWEQLSERIAKETGIQPEYLLLTAVHNHAAPAPFGMYGASTPQSAAYTTQLVDATVEAVKLAKANLQP